MTIDLERFAQETTAIVPVVGGWGKVQTRRFESSVEDGWYKVLLGNQVAVIRKATQLEIFKTLKAQKSLRVYSVGTEGVPVNFDNFRKKGYSESVQVHFLTLPFLEVAKIVQWEDKRFYFYEQDNRYERSIVQGVKKLFEERGTLREMRGITPEIRYAYLLGEIARDSYEAVSQLETAWTISPGEFGKRIESFRNKFINVLRSAIENAGATYISHVKRGDGYVVEWQVGGQVLKSQIGADLRILSAGFCLSGDDRRHSMNSIVNLAKMFQERSPLYVTRE